MSGEKICAINHDRKEFMAVGHSSWGDVDLTDIPKTMIIMAPCVQKAIEQFNYHSEQFGVQELMLWSQAETLGYDRKKGYWE